MVHWVFDWVVVSSNSVVSLILNEQELHAGKETWNLT